MTFQLTADYLETSDGQTLTDHHNSPGEMLLSCGILEYEPDTTDLRETVLSNLWDDFYFRCDNDLIPGHFTTDEIYAAFVSAVTHALACCLDDSLMADPAPEIDPFYPLDFGTPDDRQIWILLSFSEAED